MRPFELLVSVTNLLAVFVLPVPALRGLAWFRWLPLVALVAVIAQVLTERVREQMVPAYLLTGLCVSLGLLIHGSGGTTAIHRLTTWLMAGLGLPLLAVAIALPLVLPVFRFPTATGPEAIGTLTYHWVDSSRPEISTNDSRSPRELMVQIWYPAHNDPAAPRAPYLPKSDVVLAAFEQLQHKPVTLFTNLHYVTTNAIPAAQANPGTDGSAHYPVLIFLEGATGFRQMNTFQIEELVSHGYIVAALDQPGAAATVAFPDGHQVLMPPLDQIMPRIRASYHPTNTTLPHSEKPQDSGNIIPFLAQDVSFVLDQLAELNHTDPRGILTGRFDLQRIGVFGVSLGGIVTAEACHRDQRLRACLMLDAPMPTDVVQAGLSQPSMWFTRPVEDMRLERQRAGGWSEEEIALHQSSMRTTFTRLADAGYLVQITGTFHSNFTDLPRWSPLLRWLGVSGPIDAQRAHHIINAYTLAFFDRHLRNLPTSLLDAPSAPFPEVSIERR